MNKYLLDIDVLLRIWARGPVVAEAIRHPNFTTTASYADLAARRLREGLRRELHLMSPVDGMRLRTGTDSELGRFEIQLSPPRNSIDWIQPIYLRINYVSWRTDDLLVTYVPAVDLEVLSEDETELHNRLEEEVRSTLERLGISKDLRQLWPLLRQRSLELETITVPIVFDSSSKTTDSRRKTKRAMKGLSKIATLWQDEFLSPCFFRDNELSQAEAILASDRPRSLLLVGPSGAGKTAVAHHLALHRADFKLAETTFWSTTGSRLMAGMCGFGMWQERCDKMVRNASTIGAVMHLGSLVELLEAGRWQGQPGVASYLRSAIDRGRLLAIAECTEEQFDRIDREEPQLRLAFETVRVTAPHCAVTHKIIRSASHSLAKKIAKGARESLLTDDGLDELQRLHQRFGTYSVSPGRELRFLESVGRDHAKQGEHFDPLTPADIDAAFSRQTGLPLFLLDDSQPLDLSKTKNSFNRDWWGRIMLFGT